MRDLDRMECQNCGEQISLVVREHDNFTKHWTHASGLNAGSDWCHLVATPTVEDDFATVIGV